MYKGKPNIHNKRARRACLTYRAASILDEFQPLNRSNSQQTFFTLENNNIKMPGIMFTVPFSGEKRVKLFQRALLEVIEGSRLLAPTVSTRSMSGFRCCCGYSAACASRTSNLNISGSTRRILLAVYFAAVRLLFCIADRDQLPGIRYQVFDTAHTRSISGFILRLLSVLMIEYFI